MAYCPLKMLASTLTHKENSKFKVPGSYDPITEGCDEKLCGFWSTSMNMCGLAAIGLGAAGIQPALPNEEKESPPLTQPTTTA